MNDRQRWNTKYSQGSHSTATPSQAIVELARFLPTTGRALDIAGGAGRHALWLAERGLDVTLADVSDVGLQLAADRARQANCDIQLLQIDLQDAPFPSGPWDVIVSVHFLWRPLFTDFASGLAVGGKLIVVQPTRSNLQRHEKPPAPFLLEDGELPTLVAGLHIEHYEEGWLADGQHEAVVVARRD
jgi:cyclopropane fatty-acyl-phospholipid synthase-like methyltransferase